MLAVLFLIKEPKHEQKQELGKYIHKIGEVFSKKGSWLITCFFAGSLGLFILFGVLFYLSNILEDPPYNIDGVVKGFILAIPLLGMVITSYTTGSVIKKKGTLMRWLMNIGLLLMTLALGGHDFFLQKHVCVYRPAYGQQHRYRTAPALSKYDHYRGGAKSERGMITSLYNSLRFLGVAFGPPLFGWMMDKSDYLVFISVSVLSLITLGLVFFLIRPPRKVS
ncbi:hypothetical protein HMSSN036_14680 [Paenibacillus macerans]|nr:hypothetical protein HMSSN036_14680 [Paenibacillus macerans]